MMISISSACLHPCTNEVCFLLSFFLQGSMEGGVYRSSTRRWAVRSRPRPAVLCALCPLSPERSGRETFVSRTCVLVRDGVSLLDPFVVVVSVAEYTTPCYLSVCMW